MALRRLLRSVSVDGERRGPATAVTAYLLVSPAVAVLSTCIGSLSDFPHPLLTTTLHLLVSLGTVQLLRLAAHALLNRAGLRQLTTDAPSTSPRWLIRQLQRVGGDEQTLHSWLDISSTPVALSSTLASVLAALVEMSSSKITEAPFWTTVRLLPLLIVAVLSCTTPLPNLVGSTADAGQKLISLLIFLVLLGGPGSGLAASAQGWISGALYAGSVVGWIGFAQMGMRETAKDSQCSPSIRQHLLLSTGLLVPPLLLSHELGAAFRSGHFGFFTSGGFLIQELLMAWCGLANLLVFWGLLRELDSTSVLIVVALKDTFLPHVYASLFMNPFPDLHSSALSAQQQGMALLILVGLYLANSTAGSKLIEPTKSS